MTTEPTNPERVEEFKILRSMIASGCWTRHNVEVLKRDARKLLAAYDDAQERVAGLAQRLDEVDEESVKTDVAATHEAMNQYRSSLIRANAENERLKARAAELENKIELAKLIGAKLSGHPRSGGE